MVLTDAETARLAAIKAWSPVARDEAVKKASGRLAKMAGVNADDVAVVFDHIDWLIALVERE